MMRRKGKPEAQYGFFDRPQTSEPVCPRNTPIGSRDDRCVDQTPPRDKEVKRKRKPFKKWHFNG